jgi:hypothetical protein
MGPRHWAASSLVARHVRAARDLHAGEICQIRTQIAHIGWGTLALNRACVLNVASATATPHLGQSLRPPARHAAIAHILSSIHAQMDATKPHVAPHAPAADDLSFSVSNPSRGGREPAKAAPAGLSRRRLAALCCLVSLALALVLGLALGLGLSAAKYEKAGMLSVDRSARSAFVGAPANAVLLNVAMLIVADATAQRSNARRATVPVSLIPYAAHERPSLPRSAFLVKTARRSRPARRRMHIFLAFFHVNIQNINVLT